MQKNAKNRQNWTLDPDKYLKNQKFQNRRITFLELTKMKLYTKN